MSKVCPLCENTLSLSLFAKKKAGVSHWCKQCSNKWHNKKRAERWANGLCGYCGTRPLQSYGKRCKECAVSGNLGTKILYALRKQQAVEAYGGKCVCCGESNIGFLTLDHINNDGYVYKKLNGGAPLVVWARNNNYPNVLQLMCYNCNMGRDKAPNKVCPHKLKGD